MTSAVAVPPAMPRPKLVPIAAARPRTKKPMSGKENVVAHKQYPPSSSSASPVAAVRSRRERPCDACRRRKSRCVIHEGASLCVLCEFHKQDCTFVESPQPRKRKLPAEPPKNDEALKKRSGDSQPNSSTTFKCEPTDTPPLTASLVSSHNHHLNLHLHANNTSTQQISSLTSRQHLSLRQEALSLQTGRHCSYLGPSTPYDPTLLGLCVFDARNESTTKLGTLKRVSDHDYFIMVPDESPDTRRFEAEALAEIRDIVGPHGQTLLNLYFRVVHPNFPIIQKRPFFEQIAAAESGNEDGDSASGNDKSGDLSPALLAGVYLMALNWWAHEPTLATSGASRPDAKRLEAVAFRALNRAMQAPKLSTVQAGLILLQRPGSDNWALTTQLVSVGQELGLHLNSDSWPIPDWERPLRKRIAWALYMQDKWSSLIHGRPSHIFRANWAVKQLEAEDFEDSELHKQQQQQSSNNESNAERNGSGNGNGSAATNSNADPAAVDETISEEAQESIRGQELFMQMIMLTSIMGEVMDNFYTQVAIQEFAEAGTGATRLILERAKPVQIRLKDWYAKLPACTRMDSVGSSSISSTGYLHLAYYATEITLHRCIVQSLDQAVSDPYLLYICRSAAKTRLISAMDFVNRLKPEHLQGFWYFASRVNFSYIGTFGSLLWATAPAQEEADFYKNRLREYRWTLSVSSKRAEFLEYAVQMLDTKRAILSSLAEKPSLLQQQQQQQSQQRQQGRISRNLSYNSDLKLDTVMEDGPSLSRYTSHSNFSAFSIEGMEQYDEQDLISPTTPPSSV